MVIIECQQNVVGISLVNKRQRIPKGQSKMDTPEKLAKQDNKTKTSKTKTEHNRCWIPLYANKHK